MGKPQSLNIDFDYYKDLLEPVEGLDIINPAEIAERGTHIPDFKDRQWLENYIKNRDGLIPISPVNHRGKIAILVGSSPAILKNAKDLRGVDDRFLIICGNGVLKHLLSIDVVPDYVFAVDMSPTLVKDLDCDSHSMTLIHSPYVDPGVIDIWKGRRLTYMMGGGTEYEKTIQDDYPGKDLDKGGGNVVSTAFLCAYKYFKITHYILVGMSLSFVDDYYFDGRQKADCEKYTKYRGVMDTLDIYGQWTTTTPAMWHYKTWLEGVTGALANIDKNFSIINSTEDGILGVLPQPRRQEDGSYRYDLVHIPWIQVAPLSMAINAHKTRLEGK